MAMIAGSQSGKTVFGPPWLYREIQTRGPGDYFVVAPTYPLLALKALPEFLRFFRQTLNLGSYVGSPLRRFTFSADGSARTFGAAGDVQVFFGHASDPDSLESATVKAAWLDEAGQKKFRLGSWEAIQRRLAIHQGRVLITTTPYDLGWLKQQLYDRWEQGDRRIDVIQFTSLENPAFPREEYETAERTLPRWKFDLYYRARFSRPANLIYESFDPARHKVPRFALPEHWPRWIGLDFGGVNTAAVYIAEEMDEPLHPGLEPKRTGRLFLYREYHAGGRTAKAHAVELKKGETKVPMAVGGAKSEEQWRSEFRQGGLPVSCPPIGDVEPGINRVYGAFAADQLLIFDDCAGVLDELGSYSRELDEMSNATEAIADKSSYHLCFVGGTMIEMARGRMPIEALRPGDRVLTRRGLFPVKCCLETGPSNLRTLTLSDGRELTGTADHPVFVHGRGFVPIGDLRRGDKMLSCERNAEFSKAWSTQDILIPRAPSSEITSGIISPAPNTCFFIRKFGNTIIGARSTGDSTFTIKTAIGLTIASAISSCSPTRNICGITTRDAAANLRQLISRAFGLSDGHGTALPRARLITESGQSNRQTTLRQLNSSAKYADTKGQSKPSVSSGAHSAPLDAARRPASTTKRGYALAAVRRSSFPSTSGQATAPVHVSTVRAAGRGPVYNLSVDGPHEYFANGILVANCDALRYVISRLRGGTKLHIFA